MAIRRHDRILQELVGDGTGELPSDELSEVVLLLAGFTDFAVQRPSQSLMFHRAIKNSSAT
jgi:hypothetical protein